MEKITFDSYINHITEILKLMKSSHQYERVFHLIVYGIAELFKCQSCAIILISPKTEYLNIVNSQGVSLTFRNEYRKQIATGAIGKLLWTGKPIVISDSDTQPSLSKEIQLENSFNSCLCVQISIEQKTFGYLYVDSKQSNAFTEKDVPLFQLYADIAGLAYHKYQLAEENMRLDKIDHETGIEKYTSFIQRVRSTFEHSQKNNENFSLILLDIDNFKNIINTYGHTTAIQLLIEIIDLIKNEFKLIHLIGRFGFDELIILLEDTSLLDAVEYASRLRESVVAKHFTKQNLNTTVSIGISSFPQNAETLDELIITAKNALFEAQRTGKNKVFYFEKQWYTKAN
ncbi:MAG: sensor domain-containing diguanylate cyclase [Bacteroidota bacterium]|nr:sensor domain-containing diguanylate cyclase [Bacteroidota bacterium]